MSVVDHLRLQEWKHAFKMRTGKISVAPPYPFACTVDFLRKKVMEFDKNSLGHYTFCNGLPPNMFCKKSNDTMGLWILSDQLLWMAQVDTATLDVAFAGCSIFSPSTDAGRLKMRALLRPLYEKSNKTMPWELRLVTLGELSDQWMRRDHVGHALPGLMVHGHHQSEYVESPTRVRSALRLLQPQRMDVATPLILHALWSDLRLVNLDKEGPVAQGWQLASALLDNPWESWNSACSGRFSDMPALDCGDLFDSGPS